MKMSVSSDQQFLEASRRRVARSQRLRLLKWLLFFAALATFCYFVGRPYMVRTFGTK
jgi:hypothetical protein